MRPGESTITLADGTEASNYSEAWRYECELRWFLDAKPTRSAKHLYLYGVEDRAQLFDPHPDTGQPVLAEKYRERWVCKDPVTGRPTMPLMHRRGLEAADKLLADARQLYDLKK